MRPSWTSLCQATAVSVATVLGTGILGLPVSLSASGLNPFLLSFTTTFVAQLAVVAIMTELLHRAHHKNPENSQGYHRLTHVDSQIPSNPHHAPSLHSLATLFISSPVLRSIFNLIVLLHFLCILSAYALAGPQAYVVLFPFLARLPTLLSITLFVLIGSFLVVGFAQALLPSLTIGTFAKAAMLIVLVAVTLARGLSIHHSIINNWSLSAFTDPFLMGTMALSGVVNLMPVTFQACLDSLPDAETNLIDAAFISSYRMAIFIAVTICYVLNVAWCYAVLLVVPQFPTSVSSTTADVFNTTALTSLSEAHELGQISTVPLIQTLQARGDTLDWIVALLVNIFIALSVTISFLVMSVGMKHFIDGEAESQAAAGFGLNVNTSRRLKYLLYFSIVLLVALTNPAGLFKIMEGTTALALNIEAGLFVMYMFYTSRTSDQFTSVPAAIPSFQAGILIVFAGLYFLCAVLVDLFLYIPSTFF